MSSPLPLTEIKINDRCHHCLSFEQRNAIEVLNRRCAARAPDHILAKLFIFKTKPAFSSSYFITIWFHSQGEGSTNLHMLTTRAQDKERKRFVFNRTGRLGGLTVILYNYIIHININNGQPRS